MAELCWQPPPTRTCTPRSQIKRLLRWHKLSRVFIATDSPHPSVFEEPLRKLGVKFVSAAPDASARHRDEFALQLDQVRLMIRWAAQPQGRSSALLPLVYE